MRWIGWLALAWMAAGGAALAADYRLGVQDRLHVAVHDYPALDGDYAVGAAGTVALPLLGEVAAEGVTPGELAARIDAGLAALSPGARASAATVEVTGYRPIFILGDVQNPGPYDFRPGLRMLQALALAGGVYRLQDLGMLRISRDAIAAEGELAVLAAREADLMVERARLEAELAGAETLALAAETAASATGAREVELFAVRREAFLNQRETMQRLLRSLRAEVAALDRQTALKAEQIATVEAELVSARALVGKGLAPQARSLELERLAADIAGEQQEVATEKLRARQAIARTEQSLSTLADDRRAQAAAGLRDLDARLAETRSRIATETALLREALAVAPLAERGALAGSATPVGYAVARFTADGTERISASEEDAVEPGDVITVRLMPPGAAAEARAEARPPR